MIKKIIILLSLVTVSVQLQAQVKPQQAAPSTQAQVVEIKPSHPQKGDIVTITYHPKASGAKIGTEVLKAKKTLRLMFSSSTFYDLPWESDMVQQGDDWVTSFKVQPYATFASFYFQCGTVIDKPAADRHYTLAVYDGKQRVKDGYYHESFSIKTQMHKAPDLPDLQLALLQKELDQYPDNFEARIRFLSISMAKASGDAAKARFKAEAMQVIANKFETAPTLPANVARVITAYAMTDAAAKGDSIRKAVIRRYPSSDLARQYQAAFIAKETDSNKKFLQLEALLKESDHTGTAGSMAIHKILFQHYLAIGDAKKAVMHAGKTQGAKTPYTARDLKDIAAKFTQAKLAPETAVDYAERALKMVDQWPVGSIRNTDDFGYIQTFVDDSTRVRTRRDAKSTLLSILALNKLYLGQQQATLKYASQSVAVNGPAVKAASGRVVPAPAGDPGAFSATPAESLRNIAIVFEQSNKPEKAYQAYWQLILSDSSNPVLIKSARASYLKFNASAAAFDAAIKNLEDQKTAKVKAAIKTQLLNLPGPDLIAVTDLSGVILDKSKLKGKIVVMDFWATWCVPCMKELPYLQRVYDAYKNNPDVVFMVINTGSGNSITDARDWAKKNSQYTFPLYYNSDSKLGDKVGFSLIPTVAVLDQQGKMQYRTIGFEGSEMETKITEEIESLLN